MACPAVGHTQEGALSESPLLMTGWPVHGAEGLEEGLERADGRTLLRFVAFFFNAPMEKWGEDICSLALGPTEGSPLGGLNTRGRGEEEEKKKVLTFQVQNEIGHSYVKVGVIHYLKYIWGNYEHFL